jgi:molybdopterin-containing oxidoreductase family membrane subunit
MSAAPELLGYFDHPDTTVAAVRALQGKGITVVEAYSPMPNEELFELVRGKKTSPIRFVSFTGAVIGIASGFALALLTSGMWELVVGGKPVYSIMPFMVVGFELLILIGALFTLAGMLFFSRLPHRRFPSKGYRPAFSDDRFGVHVAPSPQQAEEARRLLSAAGALQVEELGTAPAQEAKR